MEVAKKPTNLARVPDSAAGLSAQNRRPHRFRRWVSERCERTAQRFRSLAIRLLPPEDIVKKGLLAKEAGPRLVKPIGQEELWGYSLLRSLNSLDAENLGLFLKAAIGDFTKVSSATIYRRWNNHLEVGTCVPETEGEYEEVRERETIKEDSALFRFATAEMGYLLDMRTKTLFFFDLIPHSFGIVAARFEILSIDAARQEFTLKLQTPVGEHIETFPIPKCLQQIMIPLQFDEKRLGVFVIDGEDLSIKGSDPTSLEKVLGAKASPNIEKWVSDASIRAACISSCLASIIEHGYDGLTTLLPRSIFERMLNRKVEEFVRTRKLDSALLFIDLDHFKLINDRYGHDVGDAVLRAVASAILNSVRPDDQVGRFGGEEIIVDLNNCTAEQAVGVAGRIRNALSNIKIRAVNISTGVEEDIMITLSIGVTTLSQALDPKLEPAMRKWAGESISQTDEEDAASGRRDSGDGIKIETRWSMHIADRAMYFVKNPDQEAGRRSRNGVAVLDGYDEMTMSLIFSDATESASEYAKVPRNGKGRNGRSKSV